MEYSEQIDICVKKLENFLQRCNEDDRKRHIKILEVEKEGWVEHQMTEWCAAQIKKDHDLDVWDMGFYFAIDVYAIMISKLQRLEES